MTIPSFQIALKIRNKIRSNQYAALDAANEYLPVDDLFDDFIKDLELSAAEQASCEHDRLAQAINTFAWDKGKHDDPGFRDVYILLRIMLIIQDGQLDAQEDAKIKRFLKLFNTGISAEQFIICFHDNPGLALKDKLPLTGEMLEAVKQLNLISAHVNFDILIDQFINEGVIASTTSTQGFIFGGVNSTDTIKHLKGFKTEEKYIDVVTLETRMRPAPNREDKGWSLAGFIGTQESLIDVLVHDNEFVVDTMQMTHQMLAAPLLALLYIFENNQTLPRAYITRPLNFKLRSNNFEVSYIGTHGKQDSPFEDGLSGSKDFYIKNIDNGKNIRFGELVPKLIHRYGFYEGDTPYRVNPGLIIEVFDCLFLRPKVQQKAQLALRSF